MGFEPMTSRFYSKYSEIVKSLALEMRVVRQGLSRSEPLEFKISFPCHITFGILHMQLSEMTGLLPADQLIIIKGEEWVMEDCEVITELPNWMVRTDLD